jgi:flavin-dependent dehydrogenase
VRTDDKGVDKQNQPKSNFEPGYDVKAKVVVLAEGTRGSLTKQLVQKFDLMKDRNPQTYGVGVKELWEVPSGRIEAGEVIYTMGYPLTTKEYGGAWIYGSKENTRLARFRHRTRLPRPAPRSAACAAGVQGASFYCAPARRRQDDSLRREIASLWRMVVAAAARR